VWDFLNFNVFVTPHVLIGLYYVGALVIPFLAGALARGDWPRVRHLVARRASAVDRPAGRRAPGKRGTVIAAGILLFLLMELAWRMMFELVLAYFQIRDALVLGVR
jgi:hypothetical protein